MVFYEWFMEATMETFKIRVKLGDHEFEAEGPQEAVERQFETFKELVNNTPKIPAKSKADPKTVLADAAREPLNAGDGGADENGDAPQIYEKLFHQNDGRLSLQYPPD